MGLDIGFKLIVLFKEVLVGVKIVVWNGLMGVVEFNNFSVGILEIVKVILELDLCYLVVGGGDSVVVV